MTLTLRTFQADALKALELPGHLLCIAPTGSGKSLIYERFSAQANLGTLLVTPLVALARQQAQRIAQAGISVSIGTRNPQSQIWILSPEMLQHPTHQEALRKRRPRFLVVDECHCLWEWGNDFRPSFLDIPGLIRDHEIPRSLWLTATLPTDARNALRAALPPPLREMGDFDLPPNLNLSIFQAPWMRRMEIVLRWLGSLRYEAGVVFVPTRDSTHRVASLLCAAGLKAHAYHAGLSYEERRAIEARISLRGPEVIVATSAFGMGMDYAHLRWSVLWQAPPSILSLTQSIGRVGRGQLPGQVLVLWDHEDFKSLEWMIKSSERRQKELHGVISFFQAHGCRRQNLRRYFQSAEGRPCETKCDFCSLFFAAET